MRARLVPPRDLAELASLSALEHRVVRFLPTRMEGLPDERATATVRSAALTGAAEALPLLRGCAADPRLEVQRELVDGRHRFDLRRCAETVLAQAPLVGGAVELTSPALVPSTRRLPALRHLTVLVDPHEVVADPGAFADLPHPGVLSARLDPTRPHDLGALRGSRLTHLALRGLDRTSDLSPLADLPELESVVLHGYRDLGLAGVGGLDHVHSMELRAAAGEATPRNALRAFGGAGEVEPAGFGVLDLAALPPSVVSPAVRDVEVAGWAPPARLAGLVHLDIGAAVRSDGDLSAVAGSGVQLVVVEDDGPAYTGLAGFAGSVRFHRAARTTGAGA
ncbi:hypothetical protein AB0I60_10965 [Actinosynnema sp. NPDC050436]|uniref:hypothetical protein n=1 Tax=Actinosynnema sp. NPDC050436 TaxID=3155659 RepID=UPI0033CB7DED